MKGRSRTKVIDAALAVARADGDGAVTMRRVGKELGIEGMSVYTYVSSKADLLAAMVYELRDDEVESKLLAEALASVDRRERDLALAWAHLVIAHGTAPAVVREGWRLGVAQ